jgi:hypothetical protein
VRQRKIWNFPSERSPIRSLTRSKSCNGFSEYGIRFLTQDQVADETPLYPKPLPPNSTE